MLARSEMLSCPTQDVCYIAGDLVLLLDLLTALQNDESGTSVEGTFCCNNGKSTTILY